MSIPPERDDPIWARLEDQIAWYSIRSRACNRAYKRLKAAEIIFAATIPVLSAVNISLGSPNRAGHVLSWTILCLGALITIFEGMIKLNSYQENWISYRTTSENLKREKFTYLAKAGPYKGSPEPYVLLAERVEGLVSGWASIQQPDLQKKRARANRVRGLNESE